MAKALPIEIRERVLEARDEGLSIAETAARFKVGTASVKRWSKRMKTNGSVAHSALGGVRRIWIGEEEKAKLVAVVEAMGDGTIEELRAEYNSRHDTQVSSSAMERALKRHGLTLKKSPLMRRKPNPSAS